MAKLLKNIQCSSKMATRKLQGDNHYLGERHFPYKNVFPTKMYWKTVLKLSLKIMWFYMCYFY